MNGQERLRIILVFFLFVGAFISVLLRIFYWQIARGEELRDLGRKQSNESLIIDAKRGDIKFSDGYPLATSPTSYLLYANPKLIQKDKVKDHAKNISQILEIDEAFVSAKLAQDFFWVRLANNLSRDKKQKIEDLSINGLGFEQMSARFYPEASIAAHLVGFVGKDDQGADKGYFGLEGFYNEQLVGRMGRLFVIRDALGNVILNDIREEKKIDGRSLLLNIDRTIQYIANREIQAAVEKYQAESGSVIVMEPKTGKVLAMVSSPKFDPQKYYEYDPSLFKNTLVSNLYEPGSTFKVLVMAAAIERGLVTPDTRCNICSGPVTISDYQVKTWNNKYYPNSTMTEVLQHSDNTGMVFAGRKLGLDNLLDFLNLFGLSEKTKIDLQGEITGEIRDKNSWYPIDLATASFGQGISITPVQLLSAVSAIANGGELLRPYIVAKIIKEDGQEIEIKPELKRRVISNATARTVGEMMVNAVEKGEAKWTKINGYRIAGKTGTAQIPIAGHYDPEKTIASFVGFLPAHEPKVSMLVLLDRPKSSSFGSETAAPVFFSIAREIINYYKIPPDY